MTEHTSDSHKLARAIEVLINGGVVVFPTDTAFGIGCRIDSDTSIERLFSIRRRPITQPTPVLVSNIDMALSYFEHPSKMVIDLMQTYWPGALTIISGCDNSRVNELVRGGGNTIGLRLPNHRDTLAMIDQVGVPILGPSANFHGLPTPYKYEDLDPELVQLVDYVLPGECSMKQASTVVDCSGEKIYIRRQGGVILPEEVVL